MTSSLSCNQQTLNCTTAKLTEQLGASLACDQRQAAGWANQESQGAHCHDVVAQELRGELSGVREDVAQLAHAHLAHEPDELQSQCSGTSNAVPRAGANRQLEQGEKACWFLNQD